MSKYDYLLAIKKVKYSFIKIVPLYQHQVFEAIYGEKCVQEIKKFEKILNQISDCNINIDSTADIRRTATIKIISNKNIANEFPDAIWMSTRFELYYGYGISKEPLKWYQQGKFVCEKNGYSFDSNNNEIILNLVDYTALLNGDRGGNIVATKFTTSAINQVSNGMYSEDKYNVMSDIILNCLLSASISNDGEITNLLQLENEVIDRIDLIGYEYGEDSRELPFGKSGQIGDYQMINITNCYPYDYTTLPYDISIDSDATWWKIITQIREINSGWEMFFNAEGKFVCQKIPSATNDSPAIKIDDSIVISDEGSKVYTDFSNSVRVYGSDMINDAFVEGEYKEGSKTYDCMKFIDDDTNKLTSLYIYIGFQQSYYALDNNSMTIGFTVPDNLTNKYRIYNIYVTFGLITTPKVTYKGKVSNFIGANQLEAGKTYSIKCNDMCSQDGSVSFLGETNNIIGIAKNINPDSQFNIQKIGCEIIKVLSGNEYDNIYDRDSANERAEYELWKINNIIDNKTIQIISMPWLDVNQKIEYNGQTYMIKSISRNYIDNTDTLTLTTFYPQYQYSYIRAGQNKSGQATYRDYLTTTYKKMNGYTFRQFKQKGVV